jgi:hypothetical protein
MNVMQTMRRDFRSRQAAEVRDECGVPIDPEVPFRMQIDVVNASRHEGKPAEQSRRYEVGGTPVGRYEQSGFEQRMALEKRTQTADEAVARIAVRHRMDIIDAEANRANPFGG